MIEPEIKPKENRIGEIDIIFKYCNIDYEILANELIRGINNKYNKISASGANEKIEINKEIKHIYLQYHNVKFSNNINGFIDIIGDNNNTRLSLVFKDCIFDTKINLEKNNFNVDIVYYDCIFNENIYFFGSKFNKDTNFVRCTFKKAADFKCTYFSHARFFSSTFDSDALFEEASFDRSDFSRVTFHKPIDFTGSIIDKSKTSFMNCSTDYTIDDMRKLAADKIDSLRESYCIIKSILISEHNILEAADWRKLELYAKEVELEYKKPKSFTREWIDKWQLTLYRYMCDHHTDTLKIVEYTLMCIATFVLYLFIVRYGLDFQSFVDDYKLEIDGVFVTNSKSLILIYMSILLCFVWCQATRFIVSFAIFLGLAFFEPKYIFGVVNFINDEYLTRCESIGLQNIGIVLYSIIFMILIFSLQKTLRKSSIIPT